MKSNLTCDDCRNELTAYLDGALVPAVARMIGQHVEGCASCRATLDAYRAISARLAAMPELPVPRGLEEAVVRRALGPRYLVTGWRRLGAAAAAVSFAAGVAAVASLPQLLRWKPVADAATWATAQLGQVFSAVVAAPKRLAFDVAFYQPILHHVWSALQVLGHLPRAAVVLLRQPEAQAGAVVFVVTLGLAIYFVLRLSRSQERGVGHACFSL